MKQKWIRRLGICLGFLGSLLASGLLLLGLAALPGGSSTKQASKNQDIAGRFRTDISNRLSDALSGIASVKKRYWIAPDGEAPLPDPDCYGTADDPAALAPVLEAAQDVLEGQQLYFSPETTQLLPDSQITYYYDETILAITWKEAINGSALTFSEVKVMDPSQFRRYVAGGEFGSGKLMLTTEMAEATHAVVACSGDFYGFRPDGVMVLDGVVRRANRSLPDLCFIDSQGDMHLRRGNGFATVEAAQEYVDEADIAFSFSFGPILIQDGVRCERINYPIGEMDRGYARAALCQMGSLHYLYVASNQEPGHPVAPDIRRFTDILVTTGCQQAYNLDGGQTATVVMDGQVINNVNYGNQRNISDILYFATAKPTGG